MRALAERLGVNPMTIYHHFGDRDGLIKSLADEAYAGVLAPSFTEGLERLEALLCAYHQVVVRHPGLTLLIFSRPEVFPPQAQRITDEVFQLLSNAGLKERALELWVNILVDFTHGAALATAMVGGKEPADSHTDTVPSYAEGLAELLTRLRRLPE